MRSLKNNIGFILALVAILASIQFSFLSNTVVKNYEQLMANDYNIVLVTTKEIDENFIRPIVPTFRSLENLGTQKIIERLSNDISSKNLSILQNTLPKFYSLKLNSFPSTEYMKEIRSKLLKLDGITKIETFSKTHDKVYKILNITRTLSYVFMGLIAVIGTLLMARQISLWIYQNKDRIEIMSLFGASFMLKSAVLYKSAVLDAIIATIAVVCLFEFLPNFSQVASMVSQIDIVLPSIMLEEAFVLGGVAFLLSMFVVSIVMAKAK
ncbi:cell division protein FtsX [Campylobacter sp. 9BO]|uniref:cell division protein FtsX n=1 Tax=Campylobacter sp. 9BO TaxID=3424759 RepID=UPI003D3499D2